MINIKDHKTGHLWDPWEYLGEKRRKLLDESWAGAFRTHILLQLPIDAITPFFSETQGRPTKELYSLIGALVLQQMHDLTDNETVEQFSFNVQWHYALNITSAGDAEAYMCTKTLWNVRNIIAENEIDKILFNSITDHLIEVFDVNTSNQRLDSVHIQSNMRHLGRIRIIATSIKGFITNLKRQHPDQYEKISDELAKCYKNDNALSIFSLVKPSESSKTLDRVAKDLFTLCQMFKDNDSVLKMSSFSTLLRVLREQCDIVDNEDADEDDAIKPKKAKDISSDSLQNPSDPDATYDAHKGKGYQVQLQETYLEDDDKNNAGEVSVDKDTTNDIRLITHVEVEQAHVSDANALIPAIDDTKERNIAPDVLLADTTYGSDENVQKAKAKGVEVVSPATGKENSENIQLTDFEIDSNSNVKKCPAGHKPVDQKKKKTRNTVLFDVAHCSSCPQCSQCPVKEGKKFFYLRFDDKELRLAIRRKLEKSDHFKNRYRMRSGIEATNSEYDRLTGVKHLRVRGFKAVRFCATIKALGINIYRIAAAMRADKQSKQPENMLTSPIKALISAFMRKILPSGATFRNILGRNEIILVA